MHILWTGDKHHPRLERMCFAVGLHNQIPTKTKRNLQAFAMHMERRLLPLLAVAVEADHRHAEYVIGFQRQHPPFRRIHVVEG